jgi:hypothetical protein
LLTCEAIDQALAAHGRWYIRLRCAIETGRTVFTPETSAEGCCQLGRLLREDSGRYQALRQIHEDFHREVGRILSLALHGRRREARREFEANPDFMHLSTALRQEMNFLRPRQISRPETTCLRN